MIDQSKDPRFYCTNKNLLEEMFRWRNSSTNGLPILKMTRNGSLIRSRTYPDTIQLHEKYIEGTRYYVRYAKSHGRFKEWQDRIRKQEERN